MKLNLLPTYVGKGKQLTVAIIFGVMLIAASFGVAMVMISNADTQLSKVKQQAATFDKPVQDAIDHANMAPKILAPLNDVVRNKNLAVAMLDHSKVYPDFYTGITPQIPNFFRVTNMQATPAPDGQNVTLRLVGVLKTKEQYRDLLLALLRMKGAQTVTRTAFTPKFTVLPGITENDQNPVAPPADQPALPKDPIQKLNALIASGAPRPFNPANGYGAGPVEKGPMPNYQEITVTIALTGYHLLTPNPSATLGVAGGTTGGRGGGGGRGGKRGGGATG